METKVKSRVGRWDVDRVNVAIVGTICWGLTHVLLGVVVVWGVTVEAGGP